MTLAGSAALVFVLSCTLTAVVRRLAIGWRMLDVPNTRSSHTRPTPRGGGVAIVCGFFSGIAMLAWQGRISSADAIALIGSGTVVAIIGLLDDRFHIQPGWRLLWHFAAVAWLMAWAPLPSARLPPGGLLSLAVTALTAIALVWLLNLYNFMDGIDGIAALEAVTVCLGAVAVIRAAGGPDDAWVSAVEMLAAAAGFLIWNFPPARIFMGDVGSGFVGLMLGALALRGATASPRFGWAWIILLSVFVVDSTWTLARRALRADRIHQPHRTHAYQHAFRRFGARRVILIVALLNLGWLLPIAIAVGTGALNGPAGVAISVLPIAWLAYRFRAGLSEPSPLQNA